jgi:hypothetical protein
MFWKKSVTIYVDTDLSIWMPNLVWNGAAIYEQENILGTYRVGAPPCVHCFGDSTQRGAQNRRHPQYHDFPK